MQIEQKDLTRGFEENFKPKTLIIVGNGCIVDGWKPLLQVCSTKGAFPLDIEDGQMQHLTEDEEALAHMLANASFLYRASRADVFCDLVAGKNRPKNDPHIDYMKRFLTFRNEIAKAYNSQLKMRPVPEQVADALKNEDCAVITTNWDLSLWHSPQIYPRLIQLHGAAFNPDSLVFPTEFAPDEMPRLGNQDSNHRCALNRVPSTP